MRINRQTHTDILAASAVFFYFLFRLQIFSIEIQHFEFDFRIFDGLALMSFKIESGILIAVNVFLNVGLIYV